MTASAQPARPSLWDRASALFEVSRGEAVNLRSMEGLRGFAVALVFMVHYGTLVEPWMDPSSVGAQVVFALGLIGHSGVDLFFVLSGYLIYGALISRPRPVIPFLARRIQRIYPTFIAVLSLYLVLSVLVPAQNKIHGSIASAVLYIVANVLLLPGIFPIPPIITVSWSLSYEMFFYLAIPLVIATLRLRRTVPAIRVVLFSALSVALAAACASLGGPVRLIMFLAGIVLYEVETNRMLKAPRSATAVLALAAAWLVGLEMADDFVSNSVRAVALFVACFVLCLSCFSNQQSTLARGFSWTPLRWLGNMSYSYYLIHGVTLLGIFRLLERWRPQLEGVWGIGFWILPLAFAATLCTSTVLFALIERRFSLNLTSPRLTSPVGVAS